MLRRRSANRFVSAVPASLLARIASSVVDMINYCCQLSLRKAEGQLSGQRDALDFGSIQDTHTSQGLPRLRLRFGQANSTLGKALKLL